MQLNSQTLALGGDCIPLSRAADVAATSLVFAGNGWFIKSKNIDSYKGVDARGKIAIIFGPPDAMPRGITNADLRGKRGEDWMNASEYAQKQGVAGMVIVPDFQYLANWDRNRPHDRAGSYYSRKVSISGQARKTQVSLFRRE